MGQTLEATESDRQDVVLTGESALAAAAIGQLTSVRVSPSGYFAALFVFTFFAGLLIYLEYTVQGFFLFLISWILLPVMAWFDRIIFDGAELRRTGIIPRLWNIINSQPKTLKISEIEKVETHALRAAKRGTKVYYRYRTQFDGQGLQFVVASGGENYRALVRLMFPLLAEDKMDTRSLELRDYLVEPKRIEPLAQRLRLPKSEVLEQSLSEFRENGKLKTQRRENFGEPTEADCEKADELRTVANQLRLTGNLLQALEAFRRALILNPRDGWLTYEFARCLLSFAGTEHNEKLQAKALAALRLAGMRGREDAALLARLGETYLQFDREIDARRMFQRAVDIAGESFRGAKGLAEVALREGKLAHVVHHFSSAIHAAKPEALKSWAKTEVEYFMRLTNDEDYLDIEVRRINLLEGVRRNKGVTMRLSLLGFFVILLGLVTDPMIANVGWACASASMTIWLILLISGKVLADRFPLLDEADSE
jgi:tetratricopeptide (TPR) repeat protein